jgi:hypothetical protein
MPAGVPEENRGMLAQMFANITKGMTGKKTKKKQPANYAYFDMLNTLLYGSENYR